MAACVALSKPGPANSGGTKAYMTVAQGGKAYMFNWHPALQDITKDTYGQIIYQEQSMRICRELGQMSWPEVNTIRRLVGKSKGEEAINEYWEPFKQGAIKNGVSIEDAQKVWSAITTFGKYAFNKSHSVGYAYLAFWSMYILRRWPLEFFWARLVNEEGNEDKTQLLINTAKKKGIVLYKPKLGKSGVHWEIDDNSLRAGLTYLKGIGNTVAGKLVDEGYKTEEDFATKKVRGVTKRTLAILQEAKAF